MSPGGNVDDDQRDKLALSAKKSLSGMLPSMWITSLRAAMLCLACWVITASAVIPERAMALSNPDALPIVVARGAGAPTSSAAVSATHNTASLPVATHDIVEVEAVKGNWTDDRPPLSGWQMVALPDIWTKRWAHYDGVVWYRYRWSSAGSCAGELHDAGTVRDCASPNFRKSRIPAILVSYWNMAGALYLNNVLLQRDPNLSEPMSRSWNTPQLVILPAGVLREGENTLLLRISGLAAYGPGLGAITAGSLASLRGRYDREVFLRHDWQLISIAVCFAFGLFFFTLWILRREEPMYGWFCLVAVAWIIVGYNQVARSPWPFRSNAPWQSMILLAAVLYVWSYAMAMIHFTNRRLPRIEGVIRRVVAGVAIAAVVLLLLPNAYLSTGRVVVVMAVALLFLAASLGFVWFAIREGRLQHQIVAIATLVFIVAGAHDLLTWLDVLSGNRYYSALMSQMEIICIGVLLVNDFVANIRRVARFNEDLRVKIDEAREGLESTLKRQYELQLANARLNERLNLAHDLHDGLGGTLVSSIALLEQKGRLSAEWFLPILKELRDDLRIIIDTASRSAAPEHALYEALVPMRHRWTRLFEAQNIDCRWHMSDVEICKLPAASTLELMRILQESLTNVLKHSKASRVDISWCVALPQLILIVHDNGVGFPLNSAGTSQYGAGLFSITKRALRCGGTVRFDNKEGACVTVVVPCESDLAVGPT
jgi:signal transduction histidine kinase